jgi:putative peptide zinc metalloprotease protein
MSDISERAGARAATGGEPNTGARLAPLREDLRLLQGPATAEGAPTWTIEDPARGRFFRIGHEGFEILSRWRMGSARRIAEAVNAETAYEIDETAVKAFGRFLAVNNLLQASGSAGAGRLSVQAAARRLSPLRWLLFNYLFFRVPLVRPDGFLEATKGYTALFFTKSFWIAVFMLGAFGLLLALRQWDSFLSTFDAFLTFEGAVVAGLTLFAVKVVHELAHAYTAKRYGCRIPTMGVAFLVLWPVLYTDTTDAWRLSSRRQRLAIGAAGVLAELGLACVATLVWSFLPDGALRSAVFLLATTTWVFTLVINLNPFMRFDGYYLLSDLLDVQNLQARSFALARWRLREWLFGFGDAPPERLPAARRRVLMLYAYATWVYRLTVFIAIALVIYHFFFKLLGLVLLTAEVGWLVARPVARELAEWWRRRKSRRLTPGFLVASTLGAMGLALLVLPWQRSVVLPAVHQAAGESVVYSKVSGRVVDILFEEGERIEKGEILFFLEQPDLAFRFQRVEAEARMLQTRILRQAADDEERAVARVLESRLASALAGYESLLDWQDNLEVTAPRGGVVRRTAETPRPGEWINPSVPLALMVDSASARIAAYAEAEALDLIDVGAPARFCPDDLLSPCLEGEVLEVARVNQRALEEPALGSVNGGPIRVDRGEVGQLLPRRAIYRVEIAVDGAAPEFLRLGEARVETEGHSPIVAVARRVQAVLIRESGF